MNNVFRIGTLTAVFLMTCVAGLSAQEINRDLLDLGRPGMWKPDGPKVKFKDGTATIKGAGYLILKDGILSGKKVGKYGRLLVDYRIDGGPPADVGMVTKGFPQTSGFSAPRWAPLDITSPANRWFTHHYDLCLPEWDGGRAAVKKVSGSTALVFIITPGASTMNVKMKNIRFVEDLFMIKYDWIKPFEPVTFDRNGDGTLSYQKSFTLISRTDKPVEIDIAVENRNGKFSPSVSPARVTLEPDKEAKIVFKARSKRKMTPLYNENISIAFTPNGKPEARQIRTFLIAAPTPARIEPLFSGGRGNPENAMKMPLRLPPRAISWMGQGTLNRFAGMKMVDHDKFEDSSGEIHTDTGYSSGTMHRRIISGISALANGYSASGEEKYAERARDWFLLYAGEGSNYDMVEPLSEASSYLCPGNATYVQASVVMGPLMEALNQIWYSGVFSDKQKRDIREKFILPRALESAKINPGMTNMQDEINNFLFIAGITCDDPNLIALGMYGSHGVYKKIELAFTPDGSTEESISPGYHSVVVKMVSKVVASTQKAGIDLGLDLDRLEKARTLMGKLAMPNGHVPNRGDTGCPVRVTSPEAAQKLSSMTFDHFGMTILREGTGNNAIYIALDHRPPAVTHSHTDKLGIILYGGGKIFGVDEGSLYNIDAGTSKDVPNWPKRSAWGYHSLVHNTITADRKSQNLGGGHRLYFQGDDREIKAIGAHTDNVLEDVRFERHIALKDGVVVMVDRLFSDTKHTYDLAHHSHGTISANIDMKDVKQLDDAKMYDVPEDVKRGTVRGNGRVTVSWDQDGSKMHYQVLNMDASEMELFTAMGWANVKYRLVRQEAPFLMARRNGRNVVFVSVINFGVGPVKLSSHKLEKNRFTIDAGGQKFVFDFEKNRVTSGEDAAGRLTSR